MEKKKTKKRVSAASGEEITCSRIDKEKGRTLYEHQTAKRAKEGSRENGSP